MSDNSSTQSGGMPPFLRAILDKIIKGRKVSVRLGLASDELTLEVRSGLAVNIKLSQPRIEGPEFVTGLKPWWLRFAAIKGSKGQVLKSETVKGEIRIPIPPEARESMEIKQFLVQSDGIKVDLELKGMKQD